MDLINNGKKAQTYLNIGLLYKNQIWDKALENLINSTLIKPYYPDAYNEIGKIFIIFQNMKANPFT